MAKNRFTRLLIRKTNINTTIGMPTAALGSVPRTTLAMSPSKLIARRATASQYSNHKPRHKPTAAEAQATQTISMRTIAQTPMDVKPSRARGLSLHSGSGKLPGKSSSMKVMKLIVAPNTKKMLRIVIPRGRVLDLAIIFIIT